MPHSTLGSVAPGPVISGPVVYCLALVTVLEIGVPYVAPVVLVVSCLSLLVVEFTGVFHPAPTRPLLAHHSVYLRPSVIL